MDKRAIGAILFSFGILAAGLRGVEAQEPAAPTGPVSYWKFEEAAGPTSNNAVAGAPAGTFQGGVTVSNTVPPTSYPNLHSLSFNGTNAVLNVPNFGTFTAMSVSVWIYRNGSTGTRQSIISFKETGGGFVLCLNENGSSEFARIWLNQGGWQNKENAAAVALNAWTHLAATYDNVNLRLYVGGVEVAPPAGVTGNMTEPTAATGIGARNSLDQHWFPGLVDDVRVYSRALTAAEVAVLAAGCPAPTALTSTAGAGQIDLSWTAPAGGAPGYTYNIKRSTTAGGPYTTIQQGVSATGYIDSTIVVGTPYYYVVSASSAAESGDSNQVTDTARPVTALPNTGLFTSENGLSTSFTIKFNAPAPGAGSRVMVVSNNLGEGVVSTTYPGAVAQAGGFYVDVPATTSPSIVVTVTGVDDPAADGNIPYTVSVSTTNIASPPDVNLTNNDNDTPGITFSRTGGLITTEGGGQDGFSVSLNTRPIGTVTLTLSSSNPAEGTVSPTTVVFDNTNWNTGIPVTLTGVDDTLLDFVQYYTILSQPLSAPNVSDAAYDGMIPPNVAAGNLDDEAIPEAPHAWGGGCGLLGAEIVLLLLLRRSRRRNP